MSGDPDIQTLRIVGNARIITYKVNANVSCLCVVPKMQTLKGGMLMFSASSLADPVLAQLERLNAGLPAHSSVAGIIAARIHSYSEDVVAAVLALAAVSGAQYIYAAHN